ncbi:hypothetical protein KQX54_016028 [Cotesia glomerata]|uniref:Uncharacterized protein n=1 Tax=Cotesia glomerata TaxID=32391 RepID=A0AAV7HW07_COTGL|nr:hypothetical protein KQX54_016028 [Cotesia glomerata]
MRSVPEGDARVTSRELERDEKRRGGNQGFMSLSVGNQVSGPVEQATFNFNPSPGWLYHTDLYLQSIEGLDNSTPKRELGQQRHESRNIYKELTVL